MTRAVKVEALKPWSTVRTRYCSRARAVGGVGLRAGEHPEVVGGVAEVGSGADGLDGRGRAGAAPPRSVGTTAHQRAGRRRGAVGRVEVEHRPQAEGAGGQGAGRCASWARGAAPEAAMAGRAASTAGGQRAAGGAVVGEGRPLGGVGERRRGAGGATRPRSVRVAGQLDGGVLAVVEEALGAPDVADGGVGHDHALQAGRDVRWVGRRVGARPEAEPGDPAVLDGARVGAAMPSTLPSLVTDDQLDYASTLMTRNLLTADQVAARLGVQAPRPSTPT